MAKLQPVPRSSSVFAGREGAVATVLGIALLVAIVKPWGSGDDTARPTPYRSATPSASPRPDPATPNSGFDATLFGPFEPTPDWSIWKAGYFVSVMYVARAAGPEVAQPSPARSHPAPNMTASARPRLTVDGWPSTITVGPDDHHLWLGVNTPRGWTLESAVLRRIDPNGSSSLVPTRQVPSPWASHFTIVAMASSGPDSTLPVWPAGAYRLELRVSPGDIRRTLEILVRTDPDPAAGEPSPQR